MRSAFLMFAVLIFGALAAAAAPGDWRGLVVLCLALAIGPALKLVLIGGYLLLRRKPAAKPADTSLRRPRSKGPPTGISAHGSIAPRIVVDGSNVMYWKDETPSLSALHMVLQDLIKSGLPPIVFFDANVGYLLFGRYLGPNEMAAHLPIGIGEVRIMDSGDPADPALIAYALDAGLRIVTNDKFRDWRGTYAAVGNKGVLVPGTVKDGRVTLRLKV